MSKSRLKNCAKTVGSEKLRQIQNSELPTQTSMSVFVSLYTVTMCSDSPTNGNIGFISNNGGSKRRASLSLVATTCKEKIEQHRGIDQSIIPGRSSKNTRIAHLDTPLCWILRHLERNFDIVCAHFPRMEDDLTNIEQQASANNPHFQKLLRIMSSLNT